MRIGPWWWFVGDIGTAPGTDPASGGRLVAPSERGRISLSWLMGRLGRREVTKVLVEGGGEVHASFSATGLPIGRPCLCAADSFRMECPAGVAGAGFGSRASMPDLDEIQWTRLGLDLLLRPALSILFPVVRDPRDDLPRDPVVMFTGIVEKQELSMPSGLRPSPYVWTSRPGLRVGASRWGQPCGSMDAA